MLYSEFIEGTHCKETEYNFKVYRNLEVMYMNTDMSKEEIYEYGKKLVDNSKTPAQLKLEEELKKDLEREKESLKNYKELADSFYDSYRMWKGIAKETDDDSDREIARGFKVNADWNYEAARLARRTIKELKERLEEVENNYGYAM